MKRLIMGARAIAEAAAQSGLEAYFGYPITPSSEIMENLSLIYGEAKYPWFKVFLQCASEIESINMLFGAGAAGHISMTATSGPGLSLMAEGISYAYASEVPLLIIDVNRGGPGLGNVAPEQSDISFVLHSLGHGGVKPIVLAPHTVQESMEHVHRGFELAFRFRTPVIVLTDALIVHMYDTVDWMPPYVIRPEVPWAARGRNYGERHFINSIYLDPPELKANKERLLRKQREISAVADSECFMCDGHLDVLFIAIGIAARITKEAVLRLRERGIRAGLFRPITLSPFDSASLKMRSEQAERLVTVEMNEGQLAYEVEHITRRDVRPIPYLGGYIPDVEEVVESWR
ncbi:MAG: transketolase C-terminal domain-containing protein [Nitrososphaeria archaeon]